jgi:hypothetical protein
MKIIPVVILVSIFANGCATAHLTGQGLNKGKCAEILSYAGEAVDEKSFVKILVPAITGDLTKATVLASNPALAGLFSYDAKCLEKYKLFEGSNNTADILANIGTGLNLASSAGLIVSFMMLLMHQNSNDYNNAITLAEGSLAVYGAALLTLPFYLNSCENMKTNIKDAIAEYNTSCGH